MKRTVIYFLIFSFLFLWSCKDPHKFTPEQKTLLSEVDSSMSRANSVIKLLQHKADSLKSLNEFESIKLYNSLYMLKENTAALQTYHDSLNYNAGQIKSMDDLLIKTSTQAEYVNGLVTAGQALADNHSFSIGKWKDGTPKPIGDSIMTPIKMQ
jgi:hypothetical protein